MTKLSFLLISSTFIILTTLFVNSLELATVDSPVETMPGTVDNSVGSLFNVLETFLNLLAFRIPEVPTLFNIVIVVIAIGMLYVIVDIVKDVIPFT